MDKEDPMTALRVGACAALPDLRPLARLTALCLRDNHLRTVPPFTACSALVSLDLANNAALQVQALNRSSLSDPHCLGRCSLRLQSSPLSFA